VPEHGKRWHDALEALALSALDENFQLASFDAPLLVKLDAPIGACACAIGNVGKVDDFEPGRAQQGQWHFPVAGLDGLNAALLADVAGPGLLAGQSLWWTDGSPKVAPSVLLCPGLPQPPSFAALLDGCWLQHGWQTRAP
jgi:type VI secretion system protein ImpM